VGIYYVGKKIDFPQALLEKLKDYFKLQPELDGDFDCSSFVHYLNDIPYQFPVFKKKDWIFNQLITDELSPGDAIAISSSFEENSLVHLAVYVDSGIYLSKFGSTGDLIFATLEEMKKGFGGQAVFKITPSHK